MGLLDKANKRNCYPVELGDRKIYVRSLKNSEIKRMGAIDAELRGYFTIGCALVLEDGTQEIPKKDDEDDAAYATRVDQALDAVDVDVETGMRIIKASNKVAAVDIEAVQGN